MPNGLTIDQLYEAFMDIDEEGNPLDAKTPFGVDVFNFFGDQLRERGLSPERWAAEYGMYLPTFDPAQIYLAERERDLDYRGAMNTLKTTQESLDRVYATESDTLSTALGKEMGKGRELASRTGLRSGGLEAVIGDTIAASGSKVKNLGDRLKISETEIKDKYNAAMVETALDYDKTVEQEKEEFYDRTMAAIMGLMETGAFDAEEGCHMQCAESCAPPLICNHCTGECQIGETPPGWESQMGPCTEGLQLAGCETYGDSCFCEEGVIANQMITTDVDAFGCTCTKDVSGAVISCSDAEGNNCEPDWSTSGTWCDQHNDDCNDPESCKYPCGADSRLEHPDEFGIGGGCVSVASTKDCCSPPQSLWFSCWGSDCSPTCYSVEPYNYGAVVDCASC